MIAIYKITSPSGHVYIGQSINIKNRWRTYRSVGAKLQPALNRSFLKYGAHNHTFEIIHELPKDICLTILNDFEILYIELYRSCGFNLLNIKSGGGGGGKLDDTTKKKIGDANRGRKQSERQRKLLSDRMKGKTAWNKGKKYNMKLNQDQLLIKSFYSSQRRFKHSNESKMKMAEAQKK